jgi:hypothetical protein
MSLKSTLGFTSRQSWEISEQRVKEKSSDLDAVTQIEASLGEKFMRSYFNQRLGAVAFTCHSSYKKKHEWEDPSPGFPRHKSRPYLKNKWLAE